MRKLCIFGDFLSNKTANTRFKTFIFLISVTLKKQAMFVGEVCVIRSSKVLSLEGWQFISSGGTNTKSKEDDVQREGFGQHWLTLESTTLHCPLWYLALRLVWHLRFPITCHEHINHLESLSTAGPYQNVNLVCLTGLAGWERSGGWGAVTHRQSRAPLLSHRLGNTVGKAGTFRWSQCQIVQKGRVCMG